MSTKLTQSIREGGVNYNKVEEVKLNGELKGEERDELEDEEEEGEKEEDELAETYEVESIEKTRKGKGGIQLFYVRWKGYGDPGRTWEPAENLASSQEILDDFLAAEAIKPKKTPRKAPTKFWAYAVEGEENFVNPIHEKDIVDLPLPQVAEVAPVVVERKKKETAKVVVEPEVLFEVPVVLEASTKKSSTKKRPRVEDTPSPFIPLVQLQPRASTSTSKSQSERTTTAVVVEVSKSVLVGIVPDLSTYSTKQLLAHHNESETELSPEPSGPKPSARKKPRTIYSKSIATTIVSTTSTIPIPSLPTPPTPSTSKITATPTPRKKPVVQKEVMFIEFEIPEVKKKKVKGNKSKVTPLDKGKQKEIIVDLPVVVEVTQVVERKTSILESPLNKSNTPLELVVVIPKVLKISSSCKTKRPREVVVERENSVEYSEEHVESIVEEVLEAMNIPVKVVTPPRTNSLNDLLCSGAPGTPLVSISAIALEDLFADDNVDEEEEVVGRPVKRVKAKSSKSRIILDSPIIEVSEPIGSLSPVQLAPSELPTAPTSSANLPPVAKFRPINKKKGAKVSKPKETKVVASPRAKTISDGRALSLLLGKLPTFRRKPSSDSLNAYSPEGELGGAIGATSKENAVRDIGFRESQSNFGANAGSMYAMTTGSSFSKPAEKGRVVDSSAYGSIHDSRASISSSSNSVPIGVRKFSADSSSSSSPPTSASESFSGGQSNGSRLNNNLGDKFSKSSSRNTRIVEESSSSAATKKTTPTSKSSTKPSLNRTNSNFRSLIDIIEDESHLPFETTEIISNPVVKFATSSDSNSIAVLPSNPSSPLAGEAPSTSPVATLLSIVVDDLPVTLPTTMMTTTTTTSPLKISEKVDSFEEVEVKPIMIADPLHSTFNLGDVAPVLDQVARLKGSKYWQRQVGQFGRENIGYSSAQSLGISIELLVTLRDRCGGLLRVTENLDLDHLVSDDEAECSAMKIILGQLRLRAPFTEDEPLDYIFIHRAVDLVGIAARMETFVESRTQIYQFGMKLPVERIFSYGFAIVPTLSAVVGHRTTFNNFWQFSMKYPTAQVLIHPATLAMARNSTFSANYNSEDVKDIERMIESGDLKLVDTTLLDPNSPFYKCSVEQILAPTITKSSVFVNVDDTVELREIESSLSFMMALKPKNTRRFMLASETVEQDAIKLAGIPGIELLNFERISKIIEVEMY